MHHPFLVVEEKSDAGSVATAEDQARRAGATLVNASRELQAAVGELPDLEGPDEDSFVFSCTTSPSGVQIWVHWYEGPSTKQLFHMNLIMSGNINIEDQAEQERKALHKHRTVGRSWTSKVPR